MAILASIQILKDKIVEKIKGETTGSTEKTKAIDHREVLTDVVDTLTDNINNASNASGATGDVQVKGENGKLLGTSSFNFLNGLLSLIGNFVIKGLSAATGYAIQVSNSNNVVLFRIGNDNNSGKLLGFDFFETQIMANAAATSTKGSRFYLTKGSELFQMVADLQGSNFWGFASSRNIAFRFPSDGGLGQSFLIGDNISGMGNHGILIKGNSIVLQTKRTIATATDTGVAGTICYDNNYIYVCTATNTWKRVAIATW